MLYPSVYAFLVARLRNPDDSEEVASEVFADAYASISRYEPGPPGSFRTWLFTIANRRLIDTYRRRSTRTEEPVAPHSLRDFGAGWGAPDVDPVLGDDLVDAIGRLPEAQQQCIHLRFAADLSIAQVAAVLGKTPNAVKQLQFRAIEALRRDANLTARRKTDEL